MTQYTTNGSIRGSCGHRHRTIKAAVRCLAAERRRCNRARGYSDREVIRVDGAALNHEELIELAAEDSLTEAEIRVIELQQEDWKARR